MKKSPRNLIAYFAPCVLALFCLAAKNPAVAQPATPQDAITSRSHEIAATFPHFTVPGKTEPMAALRDLFWQHYPGLSPKATLWDEWLLSPGIWPATNAEKMRAAWRRTLLNRIIDPNGYVATHQHASIAHQHGWPFPSWNQGAGGFGWHFSFHNTIGEGWRPTVKSVPDDWMTTGTKSLGIEKEGWALNLTTPHAAIAPPAIKADPYNAPFVQLRWRADDLPTTATPYLEWTTDSAPDFAPERRFYFDPPKPGAIRYTMIPVYLHPQWKGTITGLRVAFDNPAPAGRIVIQALFAQYDTRHDINNPSYVSACVDYFHWTHDLNFLRENIERIRLAMRFMETEFGTDKNGIVTVPWVGHEGTSGIGRNPDGSVKMLHGRGVGNNYWDLMPFGRQDSYATIRHYGATRKMATLEAEIAGHPGWNIPTSPLMRTADHWYKQAAAAKKTGNKLFWNDATGRFTLGVDSEGNQADYGYTFLNLEAIYYDFATPQHARQIMDWISGKRIVAGDTAQGSDIYKWRFAPRATTLRNTDHYGWFWNNPESIDFGDQVQDGGAVLGFSYHDIMARLKTLGPDDAARRLEEIMAWYREVMNEGGYRAYYDGEKHDGTLQGAGTPGGLGLDKEFFESGMIPQVMLEGFIGFKPTGAGFKLRPNLPATWPSLTIDNIRIRGASLKIAATSQTLTIERMGDNPEPFSMPLQITISQGWRPKGGVDKSAKHCGENITYEVPWDGNSPLVLERYL